MSCNFSHIRLVYGNHLTCLKHLEIHYRLLVAFVLFAIVIQIYFKLHLYLIINIFLYFFFLLISFFAFFLSFDTFADKVVIVNILQILVKICSLVHRILSRVQKVYLTLQIIIKVNVLV